MEEWKFINGYEGYYQVSNLGNIRSVDRIVRYKKDGFRNYPAKNFKLETTKDNYQRVVIMKEAVKKRFMVHRLVAETFIDNVDNKPQVNHIDGNKSNNVVENLEWCTNSENMLHADRLGLRDMSKHQPSNSKKVKCSNGMIFDSMTKAVKWLGANKNSLGNISRAIRNNKPYKEYYWEFFD